MGELLQSLVHRNREVTFYQVMGWIGMAVAVLLLLCVLLAVIRTEQETVDLKRR